jgi:hypothetical protein
MDVKIGKIEKGQDGRTFITLILSNIGNNQIQRESKGESKTIKLGNGMEARINWIGRNNDKQTVTIPLVLSNKSRNTIYLTHIGNASSQDNLGNSYNCHVESGVFNDPNFFINGNISPRDVRQMTKISPETDVAVGFVCSGKGNGPVMSFSKLFGCRSVSDPIRDETISEEQKCKSVFKMNLSFPSISVTDAE